MSIVLTAESEALCDHVATLNDKEKTPHAHRPHYARIFHLLAPFQSPPQTLHVRTKEAGAVDDHIPAPLSFASSKMRTAVVVEAHVAGRAITLEVRGLAAKNATSMFDMMLAWLKVALPCAGPTCCRTLHVVVYATRLSKRLPSSKQEVIGRQHVNSAFTTTCPVDGRIVIFRREEWFKVFLHETFHCFGFDFSHGQSSATASAMERLFAVESNHALFEAYAEVWARILNAAIFLVKSGTNAQSFSRAMPALLQLEAAFACSQAKKVLAHNSLTFDNLLSLGPASSRYREGTNVLQYYVITAALLANADAVVKAAPAKCPFRIRSEAAFVRLVEHVMTDDRTKAFIDRPLRVPDAGLKMALLEY